MTLTIGNGITLGGGLTMTRATGITIPDNPIIGTATTTGTTTATVSFTAPADNGGSTILSYTATSSPSGITGTLSQAGSGTITVNGLSPSTSYTFKVTATNSIGVSSPSASSNSITTFTIPANTVAPVVSGTATVGQTLSTTNGTWTGTATITFTYQWQRNGVDITSATSGTYTLVAADASNPIRCVVTGTNSYGNSSANSNATASVAAIAPGAPTIGAATATGESTATVAFTAPASNGGATITTYTATSSPAGGTGTLSQAGSGTITVTGLTQATSYTFTVTATNSVGTGSASAASNSITTTASYFNYNTLLLPGASTTFVDDASTNNFALTINGDTKPNSLNPYTPGYYSNYFDGTGDYLTAPNNAAFNLSSGDWTIEGWFYFNALVTGATLFAIVPTSGSNYSVYLNGTSGQIDISQVGSSTITMAASGSIAVGSWYHIAFVKTSTSTITCYVNGVTKNNTTSYTFSNSNSSFYIGENPIYSGVMSNGYISNFRVVKGVAVYTGAFTPPASPLTATQSSGTNIAAITGTQTSLLTVQSTTFIDNSTNNFTISAFGNSQPTIQNPFGYTSATTNGYTVIT